jgi:putative ABC transport system ATP-binding protein
MRSPAAIDIEQLSFTWPGSARPLLNIPALSLPPGASLFLQGASGSGKSTLLNLIAGVQHGYRGSIRVCGAALEQLSPRQRDQLRADNIGVIFQQFNLLPWLSPLENVTLGCRFSAQRRHNAQQRSGSLEAEAARLLHALGLGDALDQPRTTASLSIGQQQRVAAARALIGRPPLVIADEPTSALDADHRDRFIDLLLSECAASGAAVLFVSHDRSLADHFDSRIGLTELSGATAGGDAC